MGYSNPDSGCRRHPNQKKLPGVCSLCLRDRLSKLGSENNSFKTSINSTFSDDDNQQSDRHSHRRNGSDAYQGSSNGDGDVSSGLKKSRSVAWAQRTYNASRIINQEEEEEEEEEKGKNGKKGLWKRLIHSTSKKTKGVLLHSLTVKNRS